MSSDGDDTGRNKDQTQLLWRIAPMIFFSLIAYFVLWLLFIGALMQYLALAITEKSNPQINAFAESIRRYMVQIFDYLTFRENVMPFPFGDFPTVKSEAPAAAKPKPAEPEPAKPAAPEPKPAATQAPAEKAAEAAPPKKPATRRRTTTAKTSTTRKTPAKKPAAKKPAAKKPATTTRRASTRKTPAKPKTGGDSSTE